MTARYLLALPLAASVTACIPSTPILSTGSAPATTWTIRPREHVDLWLHGFAMLQNDSSLVPYFRLSYLPSIQSERRRLNVLTSFDANRETLLQLMRGSRTIASAQFLALYFASWDDLRTGADIFFRAGGDARATDDPNLREVVATFATYFPMSQDREWLRLFLRALQDESTKFFHRYWLEQQTLRAATLAQFDSLWRTTDRPRLQRFLSGNLMSAGEIIPALALEGEGRTLTQGKREGVVATSFPADAANAREALYTFVHDVAGTVVTPTVQESVTPEQRAAGQTDAYVALASIRGGAMLLERLAPELVLPYMRYYLRVARNTAGEPAVAFPRVFPLPVTLRDAVTKRIDSVLRGI